MKKITKTYVVLMAILLLTDITSLVACGRGYADATQKEDAPAENLSLDIETAEHELEARDYESAPEETAEETTTELDSDEMPEEIEAESVETSEESEAVSEEPVAVPAEPTYKLHATVSISQQHVWFYVDDALVAESDCVTGNAYSSPTPLGTWEVWIVQEDWKIANAYYCAYGMFFNGEIAIHDASAARSAWGGEIYKGSGSLGCVNVPREFAKTIYDYCKHNEAVLGYRQYGMTVSVVD